MSRILRSIAGNTLGLDQFKRLICPKGFLAGAHGSQIAMPAPAVAVDLDDFLGKSIQPEWDLQKGSDATAASFAVLQNAVSGLARAATGAGAGASFAVNGVQ